MPRWLSDRDIQIIHGALTKAAAVIGHEREVFLLAHARFDRNGEPRLDTLDEAGRSTVGVFNYALNRIAYADEIAVGRQPSPKAATRDRIRRRLAAENAAIERRRQRDRHAAATRQPDQPSLFSKQ